MNTYRLNTKLITNMSSVLLMPVTRIRKDADIATTTWYHIMHYPETITIQQLLNIANGLHIPVRRFFLTDGKDVAVKRCEDYIADDYKPCGYDGDALREIVKNRRDATWQKAVDATGITRDNLKNSLLAVRRTPVTRFLVACQALKIDPFSILLDPNPEPKPKGRRPSSAAGDSALHAEVKLLRKDVESLSQTVDDLKGKYENLIRNYEQLARRLQVNIGTINDSTIGTINDSTIGTIGISTDTK